MGNKRRCAQLVFWSRIKDTKDLNKILKEKGDIRVLKSRNLSRDGSKIIDIKNYRRWFVMRKITETNKLWRAINK